MGEGKRPLRVAVWCAVSTPEQAAVDKDSLPAQERDGAAWAEARGGEVVRVYTVPGHSRQYIRLDEAERDMPAYRALAADCERQAFDVLWCRHRNRLGRTLALIATVEAVVRDAGAEVYSAFMPHQVGQQTGSQATLLSAIEGWQSEADNLERQAKHDTGMRARIRKRGLHPNHWPLGYQPVRGDDGQVVGAEFDEQIGAVDLMTRMFLQGQTYQAIGEALEATAYRPPKSDAWHRPTIRGILFNDTYAGIVSYGTTERGEPSPAFPARWDAETYAGILRERERRSKPVVRRRRGPLSGVAFCLRCEGPMHRYSRRGRQYGLCCGNHRHRNDPYGKPCHPNYLPERRAIEAIAAFLQQLTPPGALDAALVQLGDGSGLADELAAARADVEDLETQRERVLLAYASGAMDLELYGKTERDLRARQDAVAVRAAQLARAVEAAPGKGARRAALEELIAHFAERVYEVPGAVVSTQLMNAGIQVWCEEGEVFVALKG